METIFFEKPIVLSTKESLVLESAYLQSGTGTVATHAYWKEYNGNSGSPFDPYRHPVLDNKPIAFVERCSYCGRKHSPDAEVCKGCGAIL